jgi:DNA-binding MarR family transcriptional regulator
MPEESTNRAEAHIETDLLSVSRPELLTNGSDRKFRRLLNELDHLNNLLVNGRSRIAEAIGLTTPQYNIVMALYERQGDIGVSVVSVARSLHVSGPFITSQANQLVRKGLVRKLSNPEDRRSTLLRLSEHGMATVGALMPDLRTFNDHVFNNLSRGQFETFGEIVSTIIHNWDEAERYLPRPKRKFE